MIQTTPTRLMVILEAIGCPVCPLISLSPASATYTPLSMPLPIPISVPISICPSYTPLSLPVLTVFAPARHQVQTMRESATTASKSTAFLHPTVHPILQVLVVLQAVL